MTNNELPVDQKSSYRRGTVMGLTAAEAFMLISFILLLVLGLWRKEISEQLDEAEKFSAGLTVAQRDVALQYKDKLDKLDEIIKEREVYSKAIQSAKSPEQVVEALAYHDKLKGMGLDEIEERLRLLEREIVEQLAELAAEMPEDDLRKLTDLAALEKIPEVKELQQALSDLSKYEDSGVTPDEAIKLGELREVTGRAGHEVAAAIRDQAGDIIASLGGKILNNGNVIFPDSVLFDAGSSIIRPNFDTVLQEFCRPWFEILYEVDKSLRSVQIEGHASSDWGDAPPSLAFELNLDLSQDRAGAVFKRCLNYAGNDEVARWARSRMAAIGFSSSRPVLVDGKEDRQLSRRVVFAIDTRTDSELLLEAGSG